MSRFVSVTLLIMMLVALGSTPSLARSDAHLDGDSELETVVIETSDAPAATNGSRRSTATCWDLWKYNQLTLALNDTCPPGKILITFPRPWPTTLCWNVYNGVTYWWGNLSCPAVPVLIQHVLPDDGPYYFCANVITLIIHHRWPNQECGAWRVAGVIY